MHKPLMSSGVEELMKIIEASITNKGKKVLILLEWKSKESGEMFRTSRSISADEIFEVKI